MSDLQIDDKVKAAGYDIPGFITQMRVLDTGIVAKVCHQDGFKNWYNVTDLEKVPWKERYANRYCDAK
jgi:hypothetical protein